MKKKKSVRKRNCIHFIHCTYFIRKWLQPFRWSLCNVSIYTGNALQWSIDQCVLLWRYISEPVGGTPALSPSSVALLPPSLPFPQLSLPFFCLPFVLWLYHSSLFLPLFLVLIRSLITASPLCSLSSHSHTLSQVLPPLAPLFHFWWTSIFSPSLPRSSLSLMLISVVRLPLFVLDFNRDWTPPVPPFSLTSTWNKMYTH